MAILLLLLCAVEVAAQPLVVGIRGHRVQQEIFSLFARPDEPLRLDLSAYDAADVQLQLDGKIYGAAAEGYWSFTAPQKPGLYLMDLRHTTEGRQLTLNLFVGHVLGEGKETLNNYRIGPPPPGNSAYPEFYSRPGVYFEVTQENLDTRLSTHFTLRQFLCKQESAYPKYVVLKESLLVLLEEVLAAVRDAGYPVDTFGVISAYRTPWYNKKIGNVPNSRHVYGDAMDFFVDIDGDGAMDDLNRDGVKNSADVDRLYQIVENFKKKPGNGLLLGGIGRYYKTSHHGGFVHIDARGFRARW